MIVHSSEAACLLQTGALYTRRLGLRPKNSADDIFAGIKAGAFSIYFGDAPIVHYDLEGRWQRAFIHGIHYLKGLDTATQAIERVREGANLVLKRRTLSYAEASDLDAQVRGFALDVGASIDAGTSQILAPPSTSSALEISELRDMIDQIGRWDADAWFSHREKYLNAYGALPFIPPDCQHAAILQATLGHHLGVAFGNGRPAEHYVRTTAEFAKHVDDVANLLGRRAEQCRNIFLAGADVLSQPLDHLIFLMESIAKRLPIDPSMARRRPTERHHEPHRFEGIQVFLDDYVDPLPSKNGFQALKDLHLSKVHLGVESGDPNIRSAYHRSWSNPQFIQTVTDVKSAGLPVGIIVPVGAGGIEHGQTHVDASTALLTSLPLATGDLVVLIDIDELGPMPEGLTPLDAVAMTRERIQFRENLAVWKTGQGVKIVAYSLEKQGNAY